MKRGLMTIVAMMISIVMFAQHGKDATARADKHSERMRSVLSLDDAQYATIRDINRKYAEKYQELKSNGESREEKYTVFKNLRQDQHKEIESILTSGQKTTWESHKAEHRSKRKEKMAERMSRHEARLKTELALSDDQFSKLQAINRDLASKMEVLHKSETPVDKSAMAQLKKEHDEAVKSILTQEQFQKWTTLKGEMRKKHHEK